MDSNPNKPGRFRDKLGSQEKTWKVWGTASLLLFGKHVVGGNVSWKDARFVPTPFVRSCRPGVIPFIWQAIKSSRDTRPFKTQSKERRDVLHKPLRPRGSGSACGADASTEIWDLAGTWGSRLGTSTGTWAEVGDWALPIINPQSGRAGIHPAFSFFFFFFLGRVIPQGISARGKPGSR